uniref:Uncharacterized protein n=1 Tax=Arundo donax TaxID=35708 RepID=A0A0A9A8F3_ARUDO
MTSVTYRSLSGRATRRRRRWTRVHRRC